MFHRSIFPILKLSFLLPRYCDAQYNFPKQKDTISEVVALVQQHLQRFLQTLVVCGAYSIGTRSYPKMYCAGLINSILSGKERVFFSLAEAMGTKVFCVQDKLKMLEALENPKYNFYLSSSESCSQIHVVPMRNLHEKVNQIKSHLR